MRRGVTDTPTHRQCRYLGGEKANILRLSHRNVSSEHLKYPYLYIRLACPCVYIFICFRIWSYESKKGVNEKVSVEVSKRDGKEIPIYPFPGTTPGVRACEPKPEPEPQVWPLGARAGAASPKKTKTGARGAKNCGSCTGSWKIKILRKLYIFTFL